MEKCCECDKAFSTLYNLRKHAKRFHPDKVNDVAPKKKFTYRCEPCKANFNLLRDFTYHKKRHSTEIALKKSIANLKCALCQFSAPKAELLVHFETEHNVQIKADIFQFNSAEEFADWKNKLENSTCAQFVKQRGSFCTSNNKSIIKYVCNRSGNYISKGTGLRHLKSQGSNKINGFCPACIKVEMETNNYRVSLISQHVGHQHDLGHLSLTLKEREKLANQMALKIPFTEILDQVRDSVQDANFADNSLFINVNPAPDEMDGILAGLDGCNYRIPEKETADESKLAKEKEKILTNLIPNLIKVARNMSSMEQVDVFKKLCAPIAPTISAIASRHAEIKKTAPSDNLFGPHNKKIIPQSGTLHSAKKKRKNKAVGLVAPTIQEKKDIALRAVLEQDI